MSTALCRSGKQILVIPFNGSSPVKHDPGPADPIRVLGQDRYRQLSISSCPCITMCIQHGLDSLSFNCFVEIALCR